MKLTFSRLDVRDCLLTLKTCSEMVISGYAVGIFLRQSFILADARPFSECCFMFLDLVWQ